MSGQTSNPAMRLYGLLIDLEVEWPAAGDNLRGIDVLRRYWNDRYGGLDKESKADHPAFIRWLAEYIALPAHVLEMVRTSGRPEVQFAVGSLEKIAEGFASRLLSANRPNNQWLNETNLTRLESVANVFQYHPAAAELEVPGLALDAIEDLVVELLEEVQAADDLPDELRQFILDALVDLDHAVASYRMSGRAGLVRVLDRINGHWQRAEAVQRQAPKSTKKKHGGLWKKVLGVLAGVKLALDATTGAIELGAHPDAPWNDVEPTPEIVKQLPEQKQLGTGIAGELEAGDPPDEDAD